MMGHTYSVVNMEVWIPLGVKVWKLVCVKGTALGVLRAGTVLCTYSQVTKTVSVDIWTGHVSSTEGVHKNFTMTGQKSNLIDGWGQNSKCCNISNYNRNKMYILKLHFYVKIYQWRYASWHVFDPLLTKQNDWQRSFYHVFRTEFQYFQCSCTVIFGWHHNSAGRTGWKWLSSDGPAPVLQ